MRKHDRVSYVSMTAVNDNMRKHDGVSYMYVSMTVFVSMTSMK